jgi:hypothetical protein
MRRIFLHETGNEKALLAGLPGGLISNPKPQFGQILEGLGMEKVGICILWSFGIYYKLPFGTFLA